MSLPIPLSPDFSPSSSKMTTPVNQGLINYSLYLQQESDIAVALYRNVVQALARGEEFPIPEYTLECLRRSAWDSINQWRLSQIALVASIFDPELKEVIAASCERVQALDDKTMALLGAYHAGYLEARNAQRL